MFSRRHYEAIARSLGEAGAGIKAIWAIALTFEDDNENFDFQLFMKRVAEHGGDIPKKYLKIRPPKNME